MEVPVTTVYRAIPFVNVILKMSADTMTQKRAKAYSNPAQMSSVIPFSPDASMARIRPGPIKNSDSAIPGGCDA